MDQIKNRFTGEVMCGGLSLKVVLENHKEWLEESDKGSRADLSEADLSEADLSEANLYGADLYGADLYGADLSRANLSWADLSEANLYGANLSEANLYGADLSRADLSEANLSEANLYGANLSRADLSEADLSEANLSRADLSRANLSRADLSEVDLSTIKDDFFTRLKLAKNEAAALYDAIIRGKIDGSCYEGECACFVGTIANACHQPYRELNSGLKPDSESPTERWFLAIRPGDTPDNSQVSRITAEWMREFMSLENIAFPAYKLVSSFEYPDAFKEVKCDV